MTTNVFPGIIDYSDDPILPPWYIPGWTSQNEDNVSAPQSPNQISNAPLNFDYCEITGTYIDANGNNIGGYLTFEQSNDLLIQDPNGTYFRIPKRFVGNVPTPNRLAFNFEGSGKVYLQFGRLDVILLTNDQPNAASVTILEPYDKTQQAGYVAPVTWVYHVKEYIGFTSMRYDITVASSMSPGPVDINTLIIPNTLEKNHDWNRGI